MSGSSVALIGIGAIGGAVAGDLADLGRHRLLLCSRTRFDRLEVHRSHSGETSSVTPAQSDEAPVRLLTDPAQGRPVAWVLLATKAHQSAGAAAWLEALCGTDTRVAVLQNGVDHVERIQPLVPAGTEVLPVVVRLPAEKIAPGRIEQSRDGTLIVPDDDAGHDFARLFQGARTAVAPRDDFLTQAWWKLLSNAALGGVCALALRENGVAADPSLQPLVLALMNEIAEVGRAEGAQLPEDAPQKALSRVLDAVPDHWTSIAVDRREGRPLEWEARNAVVGRLGRRHGIATPLNDAVTALLSVAGPER